MQDASGGACSRSTFHATLLGLSTAHSAAGTRKVGDTKVKKDREMRSQIARRKTKVGVAKRVAAVCLDAPRLWALRHDEEANAVFASLEVEAFEAFEAPGRLKVAAFEVFEAFGSDTS